MKPTEIDRTGKMRWRIDGIYLWTRTSVTRPRSDSKPKIRTATWLWETGGAARRRWRWLFVTSDPADELSENRRNRYAIRFLLGNFVPSRSRPYILRSGNRRPCPRLEKRKIIMARTTERIHRRTAVDRAVVKSSSVARPRFRGMLHLGGFFAGFRFYFLAKHRSFAPLFVRRTGREFRDFGSTNRGRVTICFHPVLLFAVCTMVTPTGTDRRPVNIKKRMFSHARRILRAAIIFRRVFVNNCLFRFHDEVHERRSLNVSCTWRHWFVVIAAFIHFVGKKIIVYNISRKTNYDLYQCGGGDHFVCERTRVRETRMEIDSVFEYYINIVILKCSMWWFEYNCLVMNTFIFSALFKSNIITYKKLTEKC